MRSPATISGSNCQSVKSGSPGSISLPCATATAGTRSRAKTQLRAMRTLTGMAIAAASAASLGMLGLVPASAEPCVDYTPRKGYWSINAIEVDPNHIDDYLTGLRRTQIPALEVLKARGLVDDYKFMVRNGYVKGSPNVMIMTHSPSAATLDPDQARDQAIEKEQYARVSKDQGDKAVAGYEKYRTFIDQGDWGVVTLNR